MDGDEELLVQEADMEMASTAGPANPTRRLAYLLPPRPHGGGAPNPPPFGHAAGTLAADEPRVSFKGCSGAPRHWEQWVARLRPRHGHLWRQVGILDAIVASAYRVKLDSCTLLGLVLFWCAETNTFAFPWGEATVTLEDVAVLGGLPLSGAPVRAPLPQERRAVEAALNEVRLSFNRSSSKKAHHSAWIKHFFGGGGAIDAELEHAAFLSLWLSRFVFPQHPEMTMRQAVFPLAVRLAHGERVALAPAVLASIYCDLRGVKAYLCGSKNESQLSVYAPLCILQLWVWERFPSLRPKMGTYVKDGEPRAMRWHDAAQLHEVVGKKLEPALAHSVLVSGEEFVWQPYGTSSFAHVCKNHTGWIRGGDVARNAEFRSFAYCLRACELVGMDCIEQYLPHRVAMQLGLDQDVPGDVARADSNWVAAWNTYEIEGKNVAFFVPQSEPAATAQYVRWWKQQMSPSSAGFADIVIDMSSKRRVKKTPAAAEADAEKERKMKKARMLANDKKRKLEELYDAKLSDWLAKKNGSSGGKMGGPKSEKASENVLTDNVELSKDQIPLLMLKKQKTPPMKQNTDKKMKQANEHKKNAKFKPAVGKKEKGVKGKGVKKGDVDYSVKLVHQKEEEKAMEATEGSVVVEDAQGADSRVPMFLQPVSSPCDIVEDTNKLVSTKSPDVLDATEKVIDPVLEKEQGELGCHVRSGSEENAVTTEVLAVGKMSTSENKSEILEEAGQGNAVAGEDRRIHEEQLIHTGTVPESSEGVDGIVTNNDIAEKFYPVQQVVSVGECAVVLHDVKDDKFVAAEVGGRDGELPCGGAVIEDCKEPSRLEQAGGGESKELIEREDKEVKPQEALRVGEEECGEANVLMEKDIEEEPKDVLQAEQEGRAGGDSLAEENVEEQPEEVPTVEHKEVEEGMGMTEDSKEKLEEVPQVEEPLEGEAKGRAEDTEDNTEYFPQAVQPGAGANLLTKEDVEEKPCEVPQVEQVESGEGKDLLEKDIKKETEERCVVVQAEEGECKLLVENDFKENMEDVPQVEHAEGAQCKALTETNRKNLDMEEEQAMKERQDHGITDENKKRVLEDVNMLDRGEFKSDAAAMEADETEATEGTQNKEALDVEEATKERQNQGIAYENKEKRILEDVYRPHSGELKSEPTIEVHDETLLTVQVEYTVGDGKDYGKSKEESASREDNNTVNCGGSRLNQTVIMESEGTVQVQPAGQKEEKQGILGNKIEVGIGNLGIETDGASGQDQPSTNVAIVAPSHLIDRREKNKVSAEVSTRGYGKSSCDPVSTSCHPSNIDRPCIEEVRKVNNGRSLCYFKDIKELEGTFSAGPSIRTQQNNGGCHQPVEEQVLVCKEYKVSMGDSTRISRQDCAPDVLVIGAPEETSRWRQEECTLQMLEDVQAARLAEKTKMEMDIRILKAEIGSMRRQVMNLDYINKVISKSKKQ